MAAASICFRREHLASATAQKDHIYIQNPETINYAQKSFEMQQLAGICHV